MHGVGEWRQDLRRFLAQNQRLLWLLGLFLIGALLGCLVFRAACQPLAEALAPLLTPTLPAPGLSGLLRGIGTACFSTMTLLIVMFLAGLSVCGAPVALAVPLFFGIGLGVSEAYYFAQGAWGVGYVALLLLPPALPAAAALMMACAESMRLSFLLCRQVLPRQGSCGGLWPHFRLYLARFLICAAILFVAGVLDATLQACFMRYFV